MDQKIAKALIDKYLAGQCTPEEQAQVETWYNQLAAQQKDKPELLDYEARNAQIKAGLPPDPAAQPKVVRLWPRIAAAASILLCLGLGLYCYNQKTQSKPAVQTAHNDITPGSNKAILTLANGQRIILTGTRNGTLAAQGNTAITKKADGQVIYESQAGTDKATALLAYNTISTPRGGQYQVVLSDGSHVWLNAASSIRFPTAFIGKDREVAITGEAYFEVTHNKAKPFRVSSNGQTVEVLGTHFNINAFAGQPMKTTLLEGSVKISTGNKATVLKPGEEALVTANLNQIDVAKADTDAVVAWKNGYFIFNNEPLAAVMQDISRWYNVYIVYPPGQQPREMYLGAISRNNKLSKVLNMLQITGNVKFKIDQDKVIVLKK